MSNSTPTNLLSSLERPNELEPKEEAEALEKSTRASPSPAPGEIEKVKTVENEVGVDNLRGAERMRRPELGAEGRVMCTQDPSVETDASPRSSIPPSKSERGTRAWKASDEVGVERRTATEKNRAETLDSGITAMAGGWVVLDSAGYSLQNQLIAEKSGGGEAKEQLFGSNRTMDNPWFNVNSTDPDPDPDPSKL